MNIFKKTTFIVSAAVVVAAGVLIILSIWDLFILPEDFVIKSVKTLVVVMLISLTINWLNKMYQKRESKSYFNQEEEENPRF